MRLAIQMTMTICCYGNLALRAGDTIGIAATISGALTLGGLNFGVAKLGLPDGLLRAELRAAVIWR